MYESPVPPPLHKPPGQQDHPGGFRPPQRKPVLPPSFHPRKKRSSFCRVCCCFFCVFFSILIVFIIVGAAVFYFWFNPKLPVFHVKSFQISRFNVTATPSGTYLNATTTAAIEVKNPNGKMAYYFGDTVVDVSVGEGDVETDLGTTMVPKFTLMKQHTRSLKAETKGNKLVDGAVASMLLSGYEAKSLAVNAVATTKVGVGLEGLKIGMLGVTVKCNRIPMKQIDHAGAAKPKCIIHTLKWINVR